MQGLIPSTPDRTKVSDRRAKIEAALIASSINFSTMWETGSFTHGTAVASSSDVDYLASVVGEKTKLPSSTLTAFKNCLEGSDPNIFRVEIDTPTIHVEYYSDPEFEITPGYCFDLTGEFPIYQIPGPNDEWIKSSPKSHYQYVNETNDALNKNLKPLIRLVKAWKYSHKVPISSFYLEMRTTEYARTESSILFQLDLRFAMNHMIRSGLADMNDPMGAVGRIPACTSAANQTTALRQMKEAVVELEAAESYEEKNDWVMYWVKMDTVFTDFPFVQG